MKRSEMIEAIVYNALSWDGLETSGVPLSEIADDVLKICESLGMVPPKCKYYPNRDNPNYPELHNQFDYHNAWEPENED